MVMSEGNGGKVEGKHIGRVTLFWYRRWSKRMRVITPQFIHGQGFSLFIVSYSAKARFNECHLSILCPFFCFYVCSPFFDESHFATQTLFFFSFSSLC